jgi:2-keto-4-pentenoate hydratase/2-oxohepta-3-ene-1,7-dioic acid hydratase in catechol pathway
MKTTSCIQGPDDPVMLSKGSVKTDWELELGVGMGRKPPQLLKAGDTLVLGVEGLGEQRQTVLPFKL